MISKIDEEHQANMRSFIERVQNVEKYEKSALDDIGRLKKLEQEFSNQNEIRFDNITKQINHLDKRFLKL